MKVLMPTSDIYNLGYTGYNLGYKLLIIRPDILAKKVPANRCSTIVSPPPRLGHVHVLRLALHVNVRGVGLRGRRRRPRPNAGRPYGRVQCLPHRRPTPHTTRWRVRITRWLESRN